MAGKDNKGSRDKRRQQRVDFFSKVKVVDKENNSTQEVFAANVSRGGIFLRSNRPLPRGKQVELEFDLDDGPVKVDVGEVVWNKTFEPVSVDGSLPGMGVQFKDIPDDSRRRIESFINDVLGEPGPEQGEQPVAVTNGAGKEQLPTDIRQLERQVTPLPSPGPMTTDQPQATPPPAAATNPVAPAPAQALYRESTTATMQLDLSAATAESKERDGQMATFSTPPTPKKRALIFVLFVLAVAAVTFLVLLTVKPFGKNRQRKSTGSGVAANVSKPAADKAKPTPPATAGNADGRQPKVTGTNATKETVSQAGKHPAGSRPGKQPAPQAKAGNESGQTRSNRPAPQKPTPPPSRPSAQVGPASSGPPRFIHKPDGWHMTLVTRGEVTLKHFTLKDPPRLAVDVKKAGYSGKKRTFSQPSGFISRVRVGPHDDFVRYVLDFTGSQVPQFKLLKKAGQVEIVFPGS